MASHLVQCEQFFDKAIMEMKNSWKVMNKKVDVVVKVSWFDQSRNQLLENAEIWNSSSKGYIYIYHNDDKLGKHFQSAMLPSNNEHISKWYKYAFSDSQSSRFLQWVVNRSNQDILFSGNMVIPFTNESFINAKKEMLDRPKRFIDYELSHQKQLDLQAKREKREQAKNGFRFS